MNFVSSELTDNDFKKISRLIYRLCGINLKEGKKALVRARLMKRLRVLGLGSIREYIRFLESDQGKGETGLLVDVMTTNKTSFFREMDHFKFLGDEILPAMKSSRLRFWTAACSSGEEPFSLAILLREKIAEIDSKDVRVLATDISFEMLEKARKGVYEKTALEGIPLHYLKKYFSSVQKGSSCVYQVNQDVRSLVKLAWLNLMDTWPMKGPFNVIFCRNVMIYFDKSTQEKLVKRLYELLETKGYLFVGHSEGLSSISHDFRYVRPAVYMK